MKKKGLILVLIFVLAFSLFACGKNDNVEENVVEQEIIEKTEENNVEEEPIEETSAEERAELVGSWDIVNLPYSEAPEEVKEVFDKAMGSVEETLNPATYIGSQVVSGMNYGFICRDNNTLERYVYVYQNAQGEIEKIEISKPHETLQILPTKEEIAEVMNSPEESQEETTEEATNEETVEQTTEQSSEVNNENTTANPADTTTNNTSSSGSTSTANNTTETADAPKTISEGFERVYGSLKEAIYAYDSGVGKSELLDKEFITTVTYDGEVTDDMIATMKDEILDAYEEERVSQIQNVKKMEEETGVTGIIRTIKYVTKDGKEIVTIKFNNEKMF